RYAAYVPAAFICATFAAGSSTPEKMKYVPTSTPVTVPGGLNACAKFNRRSDVSDGPNCAMNGFAAVSSVAEPQPTTNSAIRNGAYCPITAAGQNSSVPVPKMH